MAAKEKWKEHSSGQGLVRRIKWLLAGKFEKIADPERTPLESKTLYKTLTAEGWEIPAGAMDKILKNIEEEGIIRTSTSVDRDEVEKHGGRKIWAVNDHQIFYAP